MPETPIGPPDGSMNPRNVGIATFTRLPQLRDVSPADVVVSVSVDPGVSCHPGARFGPSHIREASRLLHLCGPAQDVELFSSQKIADAGEISANPFPILEAVDQREQGATELSSRGTRLVTLGGDHTIAVRCGAVWFGAVWCGVAKNHRPVVVLSFTARLDTLGTYFRRASEEDLIDLTTNSHLGTGVRSTDRKTCRVMHGSAPARLDLGGCRHPRPRAHASYRNSGARPVSYRCTRKDEDVWH